MGCLQNACPSPSSSPKENPDLYSEVEPGGPRENGDNSRSDNLPPSTRKLERDGLGVTFFGLSVSKLWFVNRGVSNLSFLPSPMTSLIISFSISSSGEQTTGLKLLFICQTSLSLSSSSSFLNGLPNSVGEPFGEVSGEVRGEGTGMKSWPSKKPLCPLTGSNAFTSFVGSPTGVKCEPFALFPTLLPPSLSPDSASLTVMIAEANSSFLLAPIFFLAAPLFFLAVPFFLAEPRETF
mmetsp:Transcript_16586/g.34229  ORF Transcript_16586/g.34229 Transcript_16586/m.34229 type:complete len:237 (+) Transcript_16586:259-969(+)